MEEVIHRNIPEVAIKMNKSTDLFVEGFVNVDFAFGLQGIITLSDYPQY
jgi:hypothetical protein